MHKNIILNTDSYKFSHYAQYPPGTTRAYHYLESRGGRYREVLWFGLQQLLMEELEGVRVTTKMVDEASSFAEAHGVPFPYEGWARIVNVHGGKIPLRIKAAPEGSVIPVQNVLMTVESTDSCLFWRPGWLECLFVRLWYPTTVATQSCEIKKIIHESLKRTSNSPNAELPFKLHDFGSRGVSSCESAGIGGMSHLVNFMGSDTVEGVRYANHYYGAMMAGYSIPASEHSTITSWGKDNEEASFRNMLKMFAKPGKIVACVSDSYDIYNAVENLWGENLHEEVKNSGATLVIRPDSGNPCEVVLKILQILERKVGMTTNSVGYKVLPSYFRIIQGDGVNEDSIRDILLHMEMNRYSASNIAFGMGGALLQQLNRDTQKFAYKCSEVVVNGQAVEVKKDPITDPGKKSLAGRLSLVRRNGEYQTVQGDQKDNLLKTVFENGVITSVTNFESVRKLAGRNFE